LSYRKDGRLLRRLPVARLLFKVVTTYTDTLTYLVLEESDHPGQKETYCIPLMKTGSQRNLDQKKNVFAVITPFSEHSTLTF